MKSTVLTLVAGLMAAVSGTSFAEARDLVLANEGGFPPYNMTKADGTLEGFDIDIGTSICEIIDANCSWVTNEWSGIIPALMADKFDVIIGGMGITEERRKTVVFSEPYARTYSFFGVVEGTELETTPEGLTGKTVGVQQGTTNAKYLEANYPDTKLQLYPSMDALIADLKIGRVNAVFGDVEPFTGGEGEGPNLVEIGDPVAVSEGVGMAFRPEDTALRDEFNAALQQMKDDGTWKKLSAKWGIPVYE
ncbi:transporter substrate-binding domain-containing protein [Notoacmeibacter sp. MSK16QG-6]|uniref:transporter substrate-binding domain-containing protein n=1 Tax=Notoacmeibacter sp. MSK16QG-6 TaxID=2957982 RepID=UPI0020A1C657|nr:transporter substrate-binding domain-containing protein [Notoacmeibacter sp. MSK16QG-6]MCP1200537.1 transporter substrate-binding domain-containing protein [Notoacmeibacter sp. MSK16QG-6]